MGIMAYCSPNVGRVSVFCVTRQALCSNTRQSLAECLTAHPAGYGTNAVPNPPYIDRGYLSSGWSFGNCFDIQIASLCRIDFCET